MKKIFSLIIVMCLFMCMSSCRTAKGYPQFRFGEVDDYQTQDFLFQDQFFYLRAGGCAFVPNMRAITHNEYAVDFMVYSNETDTFATITALEVICSDEVIISQELNQKIVWQSGEEGTSSGAPQEILVENIAHDAVRVAIIPMESVCFEDGDQILIRLSVTINKDGQIVNKVIDYPGEIWEYTTIVFPV